MILIDLQKSFDTISHEILLKKLEAIGFSVECLMYQHSDVNEIDKQLNKNFENICDWFVDNKLSKHFEEDKTKSILFASKRKIKNARKLNVKQKKYKNKATFAGYISWSCFG